MVGVVVVHINSNATHNTAGQSPLAWGFAGFDPDRLPADSAAWVEGTRTGARRHDAP